MEDFDRDDLPLSRTKKKQQAKDIELLAEHLVELGDNQFSQLKLPEQVLREAEAARATKGRSSQRRQLKHLAGMLRKIGDELEQIKEQLTELDQVARTDKRQFHQLEKLRDRLCRQDSFDAAFNDMLELVPISIASQLLAWPVRYTSMKTNAPTGKFSSVCARRWGN